MTIYYVVLFLFSYLGGFYPRVRFPAGARVGKIEPSLPYHMYNVNTTDKKVLKYTKRKLMTSATTLPNLKKM
jgi:hypothetical protein